MANNRFRRVMWQPNTEYLPNVQEDYFPDLTPVATVLDNYQQAYDASANYPLPKYLTQSETDRAGFEEYRSKLEGLREQAINKFTEQDFQGGVSSLRGMADYLKRAQTSGGLFNELERGVAEYQAAKEEIDKIYGPEAEAYDPRIYNYMLSRLQKGIDPLRDEQGNFSRSIAAPKDARYISEEAVIERANSVLDNLTLDQVALNPQGLPQKLRGVSFQYALENGYMKYMDRNKLYNVLTNAIGPDITSSYDLFGRAYGLERQGDFQKGSPEEIIEGINSASPFREESRLGRLMNSLFNSKLSMQEQSNKKLFTDQYGMKTRLRKDEKEEDERSRTFRTRMITMHPNIGKLSFGVNEKGNITTSQMTLMTDPTPGGGFSGVRHTGKDTDTNFIDYLTSEEFMKENRFAYGIAQKNMAALQDMEPKAAYDFLQKQVEQSAKNLSMTDGIMTEYPDQGKERTNELIGFSKKSNAFGFELAEGNLVILDGSTGSAAETIDVREFLDRQGISPQEFKEGFAAHGRQRSDNGLAIDGEIVSYTDPDGNTVQMVLTDYSEETIKTYAPIHELYSPVADVNKEESTLTYVPQVDMWMRSKPRNIYQSDRLGQQIRALERQAKQIRDPQERQKYFDAYINPLDDQRRKIMKSGNDVIVERTIELYDANNNRVANPYKPDEDLTIGGLTNIINSTEQPQ